MSRTFRRIAHKRLDQFSHIHVRVYEGLERLHKQRENSMKGFTEDVNWHPSACLLLCEMSPTTLGIAVDVKPSWKDVRVLIALLEFFRNSVEHVHMDSPIVEMLLKDMNNQKVTQLLSLLCKTRRVVGFRAYEEHGIAPLYEPHPLQGPFFPKLKQFTVTSSSTQLVALSRLMNYSVAVDMIFAKEEIDLVCLQVILGGSWCRSKQRLFRHVNTFKKWSKASDLGVKYVQQFQGEPSKKRRARM